MQLYEIVDWLLGGPLWIMLAAAVPVAIIFALFANLPRSASDDHKQPPSTPHDEGDGQRRE